MQSAIPGAGPNPAQGHADSSEPAKLNVPAGTLTEAEALEIERRNLRATRTDSSEPVKLNVPAGTLTEAEALEIERCSLRASRKKKIESWIGIGCSGGGIRSATFCLGALQRLAGAGLLEQADYLSTVSGGGYTGSSLQWWWHRDGKTNAGTAFPYGVELRSDSWRLRSLRNHGSYLTPGDGITFWSGIAVVLRTIFLNMAVWFPLLVLTLIALVGLPKLVVSGTYPIIPWNADFGYIAYPRAFMVFLYLAALMVGLLLIFGVLLAWTSILIPPETRDNAKERLRRGVTCALVSVVLFGIALFGRQYSKVVPDYAGLVESVFSNLAVFLVGLLAAATIFITLLQLLGKLPVGLNYLLRRSFDSHAGSALILSATAALIGSIPFVAGAIVAAGAEYQKTTTLAATATVLSGVVSGLYGHLVQAQRALDSPIGRWLAAAAAGAFLYLLAIIAYIVADFLTADTFTLSLIVRPFPTLVHWYYQALVVVCGSIVFALVFGWFSNLNHLGLHRFYRDRLMEAFMPTYDDKGKRSLFTDAEGTTLSEIWPDPTEAKSKPLRPYPLINANVILVNDPELKFQIRGGDNFILSPLLVGSSATGWQTTSDHIKQHGPLTLASAMAGSGAAANANAAYIGSGITRDRIVSALMMMLNMRLGIWIGSPSGRPGRPNHFRPALTHGIFRWGYRRTSRFVELSDGGHFDNLGLYELVRRRADLMIIIDAEEDPSTAMKALVSACQRIREDFGTEIEIGNAADILYAKERNGYPLGAKFAQQPFFCCKVQYPAPDRKSAALLYIKASMVEGLGFTVRGYRAANAEFPNQPTADQFFDAAQFEAYRELGHVCASAMIDHFKLDGKKLLDTVFAAMQLSVPTKPSP
ncbi:hypothetical protein [Bradyrhizobium mercantei]|uniref:hypothetical protein n=1 Tax=Bradyrhizobium mercantei TaxID=1904807 RepID=UPI000977232F|nr:hypothetical protein [Bradyrhizobium mercantei]